MKIFHVSDLHVGKSIYNHSLIKDQEYIFNQIIDYIKEYGPDTLLITGDIYDKAMPSIEAVKLFDGFLTRLVKENMNILIISGNHDSPERLSFLSDIVEKNRIYFYSVFEGFMKHIILEDSFGDVNFYLLPFVKPQIVKRFFPDKEIENYDDAIKLILEETQLDKSKRNILLMHQFAVYQGQSEPERSDSEIGPVGGIDVIDASMFNFFDYVALGHLHKAQKVGQENIRYAGSPLKYSFSECNHKKSIAMIDICEKNDVKIDLLPLIPKHDMVQVKGSFFDIINGDIGENFKNDDYFHIVLTDENEIFDVLNKIRTVYPNVMQLEFDNTRMRKIYSFESSSEAIDKTPFELFYDFYFEQNGSNINERQQEIMESLLSEVKEEI